MNRVTSAVSLDTDEPMLQMPLLEHLEELRARIIRALMGGAAAFVVCLIFSERLWKIVQAPLIEAVEKLEGQIIATDPTEQFSIIYVWTPFVASLFITAPWAIYQMWAFIAPGLYKRERRWAVPFIVSTAGLFLAGGAFAYFVAFRYGLAFLLSIGHPMGVKPLISIERYFTVFVNVMLGAALTFELPVLIFFLTLIRLASPSFLLRHSRYAMLVIVLAAALITPSPSAFDMAVQAVPMCLLYFLGVFASYLLVLHRENRSFPWGAFLKWLGIVVLSAAAVLWIASVRYGYRLPGS